jgi:RNA polymerase sigma-70 factor (ECF subfamily)
VQTDDNARDLDLHRRLVGGDHGAFDDLYRAYASAAYGLALRVTGQPALAQEVVSDAFMALWRAPEAFDPARGAFRTFLLSLTHHRAVDTVRREERLRRRTQNPMNLLPDQSEDVAEEVVAASWLARRRVEVKAALEDLSEDQRKVIELAYFGGMTQVEIAQELDIPLGTVKTRTLAAMRKMRSALEEGDG